MADVGYFYRIIDRISPVGRSVFYVSDSTGITAEGLGCSVLAQFDGVEFIENTLSFIDSVEKATQVVEKIRQAKEKDGERPIVFFTFSNKSLASIICDSVALNLDCLESFIHPMEAELKTPAAHTVGRGHATHGWEYQRRIDALNFTMKHDDGFSLQKLGQADIILIGVSRSGKTPTSLYMALHYGIFAANYPLVDEDLVKDSLPEVLQAHIDKIYGLTITPQRLTQIREKRRPGSRYAQAENCVKETRAAMRIFENSGVPYFDVTNRSVEELASKILQEVGLSRHF